MFEKKLYNILDKLNDNSLSREAILKQGIDVKLERSLNTYINNVKKVCGYLLSKNLLSVITAVNRSNERREEDE